MSAKRIAVAFVLAWMLVSLAFSQATMGSIKGRVLDESGALVPGATVTVTAGRFTRSVVSGNDGSFTMIGVPTGMYTIQATAPGLKQAQTATVQVNAGGAATIDLALRVQAEAQQVTVQDTAGAQVTTDPAQNAGALVLRGEDLASLPDDPDDLAEDLQALAGPAAGPNGGQIFIDGFSGGRLPPKESIREIRINQNPFSAEYDRLGMGRIEIFTKPGTDKYRGSVGFSFSDGALNSRNPYSVNKPPYQSKNYNGNFSGPMGKKASFFLDFERRDNDDNAVVSATILDASLNRQTLQESIVTPQHRTTFSPRVDYQLTPNITLMGRYTWSQNDSPIRGVGGFSLPTQASSSTGTQQSAQISETWIVNSRMINETRFQYSRNRNDQSAPVLGATINVQDAFVTGGSALGTSFANTNNYEVQNYTSLTAGAHTLRFGGRVRTSLYNNSQMTGFNGTFLFTGGLAPLLDANNQATGQMIQVDSLEVYRRTLLFAQLGYSPALIRQLGGGASQFTISGGQPYAAVDQTDVGVFVQDDWRLRPNVTVSLGLRYETQTNISDFRDFAPRIGIAWAPGSTKGGARPKTVIRAGTGMFYDRIDDNLTLNAIRFNGVNQQQYTIRQPDFFPNPPSIASLNAQARPQTIRQLYSGLMAPYIIQSAVGIERQLPGSSTIAVTYTNSHGVHNLMTRNINAPLPGTRTVPFPSLGVLDLYESTGMMNQNQMSANFSTRFSRRLTMNAGYYLNFARSNTDGTGFLPVNQYDTRAEYGRAAFDTRHRVNIMGSYEAKYGIRFSPFVMISSSRPFNITTGADNNGDQVFNDRPAFATAADLGKPNIVQTRFGIFNTLPGPADVMVPRNYFDGPGSVSVNLRVGKTWGFGPERGFAGTGSGFGGGPRGGGGGGGGAHGAGGMRMGGGGGGFHGGGEGGGGGSSNKRFNLTASANARNLLNHTNPGPYIGSLSSPLFGQSNSLGGSFHGGSANNRGIDFSLRFTF